MRGQTNLQKKLDWADTLKCLKAEMQPRRLGERRKDGSLPTHPTHPIEKPEAEVLAECLEYLRRKGYQADRQNNGKFYTNGGWHTYGIVGSGDIIGMTEEGRHIEVECKAGMWGVWKIEQQRRCERVRRHKGLYLLVHSVEELSDDLGSVERLCNSANAGEEDFSWTDSVV